MRPRRIIVAGAGGLAVIVALLLGLILSRRPVLITESCVMAQPVTNVLFTRSFQREMVQAFPGVIRVSVSPVFNGPPATNVIRATNGAAIRIRVIGPTAETAIAFANEATAGVRQRISTNYGVRVYLLEQAKTARSCSSLLYTLSSSANSIGN